jgi:hypothetical protein
MLEIEGIVTIIVGAATTVIALIALWHSSQNLRFTANSYLRVRRTEQIRLVEGIMKDVMDQFVKYDLAVEDAKDENGNVDPSQDPKLDKLLDRVFGMLIWFAFLVKTEEIEDQLLVKYWRTPIIDWYEKTFVPIMPEAKEKGLYPQFQELYKKFKKEEEEENRNQLLLF